MKTYITPVQQNRQLQTTSGHKLILVMASSIHEILAMLGAMTAATAIVMLFVWVAGMEISNILSASIWGLGFVFLGLAVDNRDPIGFLQLVTGLALLVLAWLQNTVSSDYTIVSGVLVGIWVAVALFRRLR